MKTQNRPGLLRHLFTTFALAFAAIGLSAMQASTLSWNIRVVPSGAGTIQWFNSCPAGNGYITGQRTLKLCTGAYLDLFFDAEPGYKLVGVYRNGTQMIHWLNQHNGFRFGPVSNPHLIVAVFEPMVPTGTFSGEYMDGIGLTPIVDITGNYQGTVPESTTNRTYDIDVAMDDAGKVSAMGNITGVRDRNGSEDLSGSGGSVRTVGDVPRGSMKGSFSGTLDGEPLAAGGKADGDLELQDVGGAKELAGTAGGSYTIAGQRTSSPPISGAVEVPPEHHNKMRKNWGFTVSFVQKQDARGKNYIEALGRLRLSNGEYREFAPQRVRFNPKTGYRVNFSKAQMLDSAQNPMFDARGRPLRDTKAKVNLNGLKFTGTENNWTPAEGTMTYQFLGQRGRGPLASFLD